MKAITITIIALFTSASSIAQAKDFDFLKIKKTTYEEVLAEWGQPEEEWFAEIEINYPEPALRPLTVHESVYKPVDQEDLDFSNLVDTTVKRKGQPGDPELTTVYAIRYEIGPVVEAPITFDVPQFVTLVFEISSDGSKGPLLLYRVGVEGQTVDWKNLEAKWGTPEDVEFIYVDRFWGFGPEHYRLRLYRSQGIGYAQKYYPSTAEFLEVDAIIYMEPK